MSELFEPESPLRHYEALEEASRDMLEAARAGDWDRVARLEASCTLVIARLRQIAHANQLGETGRQNKLRILRNILANDAEIRRISEVLPPTVNSALQMATAYSRSLH